MIQGLRTFRPVRKGCASTPDRGFALWRAANPAGWLHGVHRPHAAPSGSVRVLPRLRSRVLPALRPDRFGHWAPPHARRSHTHRPCLSKVARWPHSGRPDGLSGDLRESRARAFPEAWFALQRGEPGASRAPSMAPDGETVRWPASAFPGPAADAPFRSGFE